MSAPAKTPVPAPSAAEIARGLGWLARNLPTIAAWVEYMKKAFSDAKKTGNLVVLLVLMLGQIACSAAKIGAGVAAVGAVLSGLGKLPDLSHPPTPTPIPVPGPTSAPTPFPTPGNNEPSATPTPTPSQQPATPMPTPTPTATPSPVPPPADCIPTPGPAPVSLVFVGNCPRYMEPLDFEGEGNVNVPGNKRLCAVKAGTGNQRTAWRLGYGLGRQGMELTRFGDAWLQFDAGRGCTDAYGRHFEDCFTLYANPEDGERSPYTWGGYVVPAFCSDPTPVPTPTPTREPSLPPVAGCDAVVALEHFMAPGDHCHQWDWDGGQIKCLVDSTIRPICDTDHTENWNTFCGRRSHDPDYDSPAGTQLWRVTGGAHIHGSNRKNYAQMWIVGDPGASVTVEVCIRPDAVTPDGCKITRRGDGCGTRSFPLPDGNGTASARAERLHRLNMRYSGFTTTECGPPYYCGQVPMPIPMDDQAWLDVLLWLYR